MNYLGDFKEDSTVYLYFTTHSSVGGALAPSSAFEAADIRIYKNGSNAQKTTDNGITMTSPFDTVTGLHQVSIDTSNDTGDAAFWVIGNDFTVALVPDETVDSQSVVRVLAQFSIENRCVNWAKVGSPTTAVNLSSTNIDTDQVVASVAGAVGSVTGAVGSVGAGGITASSFAANAITAAKLDPDVTTELQAGLALESTAQSILTDTAEIGVAGAGLTNINLPNQTMDIIGSLSGSVGSVTAAITLPTIPTAWITADGIATDAIGSAEVAASAVTKIQAGLSTLDAAGVRTAVGLASANLDTQLAAIDTETDKIASIKTKTDSLTFTVSGQVDANAESMNGAEILGDGTSGDLWRGA